MPKPQEIFLKDYQTPNFELQSVFLTYDIFDGYTIVTSKIKLSRVAAGDLQLLGRELELESIQMDGVDFTSSLKNEAGLLLQQMPDAGELTIQTKIYPEKNTALEGLYHSGKMYCTQCEPEGFRRMTYFPDRPDVMTKFTTKVIADQTKCPVLLSNGNKIDSGSLDGVRHFATWEDPIKKPAYLFALVAGDLKAVRDEYITMSGKKVNLEVWVDESDLDKCDHAVTSLKQSMKWDEDTYGREYDLDIFMIVAVSDFNMGAMENKGLNIFNSSCVLANPKTATDSDFAQVQGIIAHEYFHNWTGNRITCRDWFQLSLKEGLTIFRDQTFSQDLNSEALFRIEDVKLLRGFQFPEDQGPMAHAVRPESFIEINNFYTMTVYNKGAELIHMMRLYLGKDGFRKGMDLYFERHDGQAVTTEDFVAAMQDANGVEFGPEFLRWYSQAGTPTVHVERQWYPVTKEYTLTFTQSCKPSPGQEVKEPYRIPILSGLLNPDGSAAKMQLKGEGSTEVTERILDLTEKTQSFTFVGLESEPTPSLLRGFSAPVKLKVNLSPAELTFLLEKDTDAFNRWEVSQKILLEAALLVVTQIEEKRLKTLPEGLIPAFQAVLEDDQLDVALKALMLSLPTEGLIGDAMPVVKVEEIQEARDFLKQELAQGLKASFQKAYDSLQTPGEYQFNSEATAKRRLKNLSLSYLALVGKEDLAYAQFGAASNMTDSLASLASLIDLTSPVRKKAVDGFYQEWKEDSLVMNHWFSMQAGSSLTGVQEIKALMEHPSFEYSNPNKLRSVIGVFCMRNQSNFHVKDGSGYAFLADQLLVLDKQNPQMAARLFTPFTKLKRYDQGRQAMMKQEIERLMAVKDLSKNLFEVVSKTLAQ